MADQKFDIVKYYKNLARVFRDGPGVRHKIASKIAPPGNTTNLKPLGTALTFLKTSTNVFANHMSNYGTYSRLARYSDYNEMESMAEISSALDIYSHETCSKGEDGEIIRIKSSNPKIRDALTKLFYDTLNIEFNAAPWIRSLCKYGDFLLLMDHHPDFGIMNVFPIPVNEIEREEGHDAKDPTAYRYRWVAQGNKTLDPWQIAHFRLLGNDGYLPYGTSILEAARRAWRQLLLMEDAVMVYRIVRSPERRVFYIDVGNVAPGDVPRTMENLKNQLKRNQVVDANSGQVDLRYNALSTDEDFFVPVRGRESGTRIDTLPGGQFTGDIEDLVYIQNKLFAALKIPKSYLGYEGDISAKCLHPDTMIPLLNGERASIKEIAERVSAGEGLYTYTIDERNSSLVAGRVIAGGVTRRNAQLVAVTLDNGQVIKCTPDHKFMLRDGTYCEAQYLAEGQSLMPWGRYSNREVVNHKIEWIDERTDCYDIQIDNFPNFALAAGVFVHNSTLSQEDVRFARTIQHIQRIFITELEKIAMVHLYSMGFTGDEMLDFELSMANPSTINEIQRLELWRTRFEIASVATGQDGLCDKTFIYTKIFGLTEDDIEGIREGRRQDKMFELELEAMTAPTPEGEAEAPPAEGEQEPGMAEPTEPDALANTTAPLDNNGVGEGVDPNQQRALPNELRGKIKKQKPFPRKDSAQANVYRMKKNAMDPMRDVDLMRRSVTAPFAENSEEQIFEKRLAQLRKFGEVIKNVEQLKAKAKSKKVL